MTARARRGSTARPRRDAAWAGGRRRALRSSKASCASTPNSRSCSAAASDGETVTWDAPRNRHEGGILATLDGARPAPSSRRRSRRPRRWPRRIADALDYVGVLALEFFAAGDGPMFNEMAPRVHNSGHWTIEGALTSQFENHIRAICGLPLGATDAGRAAGRDAESDRRRRRRLGATSSPTAAPTSTSTARATPGPAARWAT